MKVRTQFKNTTAKEQELFLGYLEPKLEQISALLTHFPDDAVTFDARVDKFDKHDAFEVEFSLKMPSKTFQAKEASHAITKAIDLSKDRLISQIKKTLEVRKHSSIKRRPTKEPVNEFIFSEESVESLETI